MRCHRTSEHGRLMHTTANVSRSHFYIRLRTVIECVVLQPHSKLVENEPAAKPRQPAACHCRGPIPLRPLLNRHASSANRTLRHHASRLTTVLQDCTVPPISTGVHVLQRESVPSRGRWQLHEAWRSNNGLHSPHLHILPTHARTPEVLQTRHEGPLRSLEADENPCTVQLRRV
jgi:hypothetical protein